MKHGGQDAINGQRRAAIEKADRVASWLRVPLSTVKMSAMAAAAKRSLVDEVTIDIL